MSDFLNLQPMSSSGSLHTDRAVKLSSLSLELVVSFSASLFLWICVFLGLALSITALCLLVFLFDFFGAAALLMGGLSLFGLAWSIYSGHKRLIFDSELKGLSGFDEFVGYKDMVQIELLKKIVGGRTQKEPFRSGEIRLLTASGDRYLLVEGACEVKMYEIAKAVSEFVQVPLVVDGTLHRV